MGDAEEAGSVPIVPARLVDGYEKSTAEQQPPQEMLEGLVEFPCFCTALTLAATALAVTLPMILRDYLPPCREPRCFQYAREMALSVNPNVDPCSDFFSHVCGNFEYLYPHYSSLLSVLATRVIQFQDNTLNRLELSTSMETPGEVTVAAFRACVDQYRGGDERGLLVIRELLSKLGLHLRAAPVTHTVESVFVGMMRMSLNFGLPVLVRAVLVRSLKKTEHNKLELQLDMHMPVAPVRRTLDSMESSLRSVAHNGSFSRFHNLASAALASLNIFQLRVASISRWDGGIKYVRFSDVRDALLPFITTEKLLNVSNHAVSVKAYFDGNSELATTNPGQLKGFAAFAVEQGGARMVNLVRYLIVERLLPLSSFNLAEIYNITDTEAFGVRAHACRREVVGLTPRAWADIIFRNLLKLNYSTADALARDVLDSAIAHVSGSDGFWTADAETSQRAKQRLQRTRLLLGRATLKDNLRARYGYVKTPNASQPFVKWLLDALQTGRRQLAMAISRGSAAYNLDTDGTDLQVLDANPNAMLDPVRLEVQVTPAMLFPPFLAEDVPSAVNYGALGSLLGSLLAQSLDPSAGAYDVLGRRLRESWFSEDSLRARKVTASCVATNIAAYEGGLASEDQTNEVLANTIGLRIAHTAFLAKLDDNDTRKEFGRWSGPFFSGGDIQGLHRLFFAANCFQLCGVSLPRVVATSDLPLRHRCNLPLMNYPEFGRAFGCPANSVMTSTNSCFPEPEQLVHFA